MTSSADADQLASEETNWFVSTLFAKGISKFSRTRFNCLIYRVQPRGWSLEKYHIYPKYWPPQLLTILVLNFAQAFFNYLLMHLKIAGYVAVLPAGWPASVRNKIPWLFPEQVLFFPDQSTENLTDFSCLAADKRLILFLAHFNILR